MYLHHKGDGWQVHRTTDGSVVVTMEDQGFELNKVFPVDELIRFRNAIEEAGNLGRFACKTNCSSLVQDGLR